MLRIKRFVNNIPYKKTELYKNEITSETVYNVINRVKNRVKENENGEKNSEK